MVSLNSTCEHILTKTVEQEKSEIAGKVFRWVATVKRPLYQEDIWEAMAIRPHQHCMEPERLLKDVNKTTSWCRDLIILDDEDHNFRFAHLWKRSSFFTSIPTRFSMSFTWTCPISISTLAAYVLRISTSEILKHNLVRPPARSWIRIHRYIESTLVSKPDSAFARSIFKFDKLWRSKPAQKFDLSSLYSYATEDCVNTLIRKPQSQYPFLAYKPEFWLGHSSEFTSDTATWSFWKNLVDSRNSQVESLRPSGRIKWRTSLGGLWKEKPFRALRNRLSDLRVRG